MQLFSGDAKIFLKIFFYFCPLKHKKLSSKVAHNPTRPRVFIPASFCFVQLRHFYSLKFSHLWNCQTLPDEKISSITLKRYLIPKHFSVSSLSKCEKIQFFHSNEFAKTELFLRLRYITWFNSQVETAVYNTCRPPKAGQANLGERLKMMVASAGVRKAVMICLTCFVFTVATVGFYFFLHSLCPAHHIFDTYRS